MRQTDRRHVGNELGPACERLMGPWGQGLAAGVRTDVVPDGQDAIPSSHLRFTCICNTQGGCNDPNYHR